MTLFHQKRRRKRILLIFFALGLLLVTFLLFLAEHFTAPPPADPSLQGSHIALSRFRHTATENDRILWTLSADRADYDRQGGMAELSGVTVTYINEDNTPITAQARTGFAETQTGNLRLAENVRLLHLQYHLETEELRYTSPEKTLVSPVKTRVTGPRFLVESDAASYDLPSGCLRLTGNVKGVLHAPQSSP